MRQIDNPQPDEMIKTGQRKYYALLGSILAMVLVFFLCDLLIGSVKIPLRNVISILTGSSVSEPEWNVILFDFRIPKAVTALLAGMALSAAGLQMQTIFRNPLAGPYVLGISAGASFGVALLVLGFSSYFSLSLLGLAGNFMVVIAAWLGAGLILLLIFSVSLRVKDIMTILVLGIMFGSVTSAIVSILQYFSNESMLKSFIVWTMGSLGGVSKIQLFVLVPCIGVGLLIALASSKILNALLLGENYAQSLGLNVKKARFLVFFSTSLLAGSITAFCGPIGFIDIAVPHIARLVFKTADHRFLMIATMLIGALVMLFSDMISQMPGMGNTLPINSVTALVGIPIIIWLVIKNQKISQLT